MKIVAGGGAKNLLEENLAAKTAERHMGVRESGILKILTE